MRILSHRLQRAVAVLGLRRLVIVASALILVAGFMIVRHVSVSALRETAVAQKNDGHDGARTP